jgi:hypothetical protein
MPSGRYSASRTAVCEGLKVHAVYRGRHSRVKPGGMYDYCHSLDDCKLKLLLIVPGSSVSIVTAYGLDGQGIETRWRRDFPHRPWGPPSLLYNGYRVFPGVRCGRGVMLTPQPLLVTRSKIEWGYTSTLPKGLRGLWKGETYLNGNLGDNTYDKGDVLSCENAFRLWFKNYFFVRN